MKKSKLYSTAKIFFFIIGFYFSLFLLVEKTNAQNFRNDYQVDYYLSQNQDKLKTKVKFTVTITNLSSDFYVKQFSLAFPDSFNIYGVRAYDDHVDLSSRIERGKQAVKIAVDLANPSFGRGSQNKIYLEFQQDNLFLVNGNIWEVIIPTVERENDSSYKVSVILPENSQKKNLDR